MLRLSLAEFSQVKSSNLFSFLNLLLVRLDLRLKLINQSLHTLMILPVFIRSISHLLDASLRFAQVLDSISTSACFSINFRFQELAVPLVAKGNLLLHPEFISQPSSINHGLLGFLIREMSLAGHFIKISMKGLHLSLQLPLGTSNGLVDTSQVRELLIGIRKFLFSHATSTVSLFKQCASFLKGILSSIGSALIGKELVTNDFLVPLFLLKLSLGITDLSMVLLDCLLSFCIGSIGMLQSSVKLNNISFQFLLHAQSFSFSLGFSFKGSLHAINSLLEVLASGKEFFLLLSNTTLNLLPDLSKLKVSPQYLVFLLFKSS